MITGVVIFFRRLAEFLLIDVNRIFLVDRLRYSIENSGQEEQARERVRQCENCSNIFEKKDAFFSQMFLCFIGRLQFSCPSPTMAVDKRVMIRWTSAGVTGETSWQPINSYSISRCVSRRSVTSTLEICILISLHLPRRYNFTTICSPYIFAKPIKYLTSLLLYIINYNRYTVPTSQITG